MSRSKFAAGCAIVLSVFSFRRSKALESLVILIGVLLPGINVHPCFGQEDSTPLPPTESYKTALAPFTATRNQANDLTDADKLALSIGMARASQDCVALSSHTSGFATDARELFALAELCIFGQQFEPARTALVAYLALPQPPQREQALLLLVRAYLGLDEPMSAEPQVASLLRDYPYDAFIHTAIDQVIDNTEGRVGYMNDLALKLCTTQRAATLPLLRSGKALDGTNGNVSAAALFADAVRCTALASGSGNSDGVMKDLAAILQQPSWTGTVDLVPMQSAFERQQSVGESVPLASLRGYLPRDGKPVPTAIALKRGTVLLIPFALWSPATPEIVKDLAKLMPRQAIYLITNWHANTGRDDVRSDAVLRTLRTWQKGLPQKASIVIVPDTVLSAFHSDEYPIGIVVRDGTVLANTALSSQGAERLVMRALAQNVGGQ